MDTKDENLIGELEIMAQEAICRCAIDDARVIFQAIDRINFYSGFCDKASRLTVAPKRMASPNGTRDWSREEIEEAFDYDADTGNLIWKITEKRKGKVAGSRGNRGYIRISYKGKSMLAHRAVWIMNNGPIYGELEIDHIDGDPSNNKLDNLRLVDDVHQSRNRAIGKNNTTGHLGIRRDPYDSHAWEAWIGNERLGSFGSKREAIIHRKRAEQLHNYHENHGREKK